jgi:hypothetical protein
MRYFRKFIRILVVRIYGYLLLLYPSRFRAEFIAEMQDIFLKVMLEAEGRGGLWLLKTSLRELTALLVSIFRERWHELRSRKEKAMAQEVNSPGSQSGAGEPLQMASAPSLRWIAGWTLLTTAAIPAALVAMTPIAAILLWFIDLGVKAGLWPSNKLDILTGLGFVIAFSLIMAGIQWYLLRNCLPHAGRWFKATAGGLLLGGLVAGVSMMWVSALNADPAWSRTALFLPIGLALGLAQWSYLRRFLPKAAWIILIDGLAAGSILLAGQSFTSLFELVGILILPGIITGVGLWLLLRQFQPRPRRQEMVEAVKSKGRRLPRMAWAGVGLLAAVPLFFLCIWIYAISELTLAKNNGIYPTVEEAVVARNSQGWGGARVVKIENIHTGPNSWDGSQPEVWFGEATVTLDRVPQGWNRTQYFSGSFYIHVREGWVHVSEGAFPEFIGWVMELYGLEGVQR